MKKTYSTESITISLSIKIPTRIDVPEPFSLIPTSEDLVMDRNVVVPKCHSRNEWNRDQPKDRRSSPIGLLLALERIPVHPKRSNYRRSCGRHNLQRLGESTESQLIQLAEKEKWEGLFKENGTILLLSFSLTTPSWLIHSEILESWLIFARSPENQLKIEIPCKVMKFILYLGKSCASE